MLRAGLIISIFCLLLTACQAGGAAQQRDPADTRLRVLTTIGVFGDLIQQVGGERVNVQVLLPAGVSPEDFQPSPQEAQSISHANLVIYNGYGLEEWLDSLFEAAGRPDQPRLELAAGLPAVEVGGEFAQGNPHFWLDPDHAITYVERIRDALSQQDAAGAATYAQNAERYIQQIRTLDAELRQLAAGVPAEQRKMVTNHDAFPYFAEHYGFTIVGNILGNPEAEPSAGDLAALVERIKQERVRAVFTESQFNQSMARTLASEAGVQVVGPLYSDALDPQAGINSYVDMMRYNVTTVVQALTG